MDTATAKQFIDRSEVHLEWVVQLEDGAGGDAGSVTVRGALHLEVQHKLIGGTYKREAIGTNRIKLIVARLPHSKIEEMNFIILCWFMY